MILGWNQSWATTSQSRLSTTQLSKLAKCYYPSAPCVPKSGWHCCSKLYQTFILYLAPVQTGSRANTNTLKRNIRLPLDLHSAVQLNSQHTPNWTVLQHFITFSTVWCMKCVPVWRFSIDSDGDSMSAVSVVGIWRFSTIDVSTDVFFDSLNKCSQGNLSIEGFNCKDSKLTQRNTLPCPARQSLARSRRENLICSLFPAISSESTSFLQSKSIQTSHRGSGYFNLFTLKMSLLINNYKGIVKYQNITSYTTLTNHIVMWRLMLLTGAYQE